MLRDKLHIDQIAIEHGLAAAEQLRRKGYQVSVYDRYDRVGGLLIYALAQRNLRVRDALPDAASD